MKETSSTSEHLVSIRDIHLNPEEGIELAKELSVVLERYKDKRVLVLAPPCSGKSTLLQHIKNGIDMDIVFDTMPEDFKRHVLHHERPFMYIDGDRKTIKYIEREFIPGDKLSEEYLKSTTELLNSYINEKIKIIPGVPVFGTNMIDTDVVVYLDISDEALKARIASRNTKTHRMPQTNRVFGIKHLIEQEVEVARNKGVIVENFTIG